MRRPPALIPAFAAVALLTPAAVTQSTGAVVRVAVRSAAATATRYRPPVFAAISRHFEPPPTPYTAGHRGVDFAVSVGTTVVASESGVVAFAGQVGGSLFVSIDHSDGLRSTYSFLSSVLTKASSRVAQGDVIARSGPGAAGEKPNLHFGIRRGTEYLDPEPLLVDAFRANFAGLIRLSGDEDRVGVPAASGAMVAMPFGRSKRRRQRRRNSIREPRRRESRQNHPRMRRARSSFASAAASSDRRGRSAGPSGMP